MQYFKIPLNTYENIRLTLDKIHGFPNNEASTCITPGSEAIKDFVDKYCLFATSNHFFITEVLRHSDALEITKDVYDFILQETYS